MNVNMIGVSPRKEPSSSICRKCNGQFKDIEDNCEREECVRAFSGGDLPADCAANTEGIFHCFFNE